MTAVARDVLTAFDSLLPADQAAVAVEILRRVPTAGGLPDAALDELADELFAGYDASRPSC